jgi:LPXTG-motif cell wall-anchored protein
MGMCMLVLLLVCALTAASAVRERTAPFIRVTLLNQEPDPVSAGQYVDIKYKIDNLGSSGVENFSITFVEQYPFSLDANQDETIVVGNLVRYQGNADSAIVEFKVRVDSRAVDGENDAMVRYTYRSDGREVVQTQENTVTIRTIDATLHIQEVAIEPEQLVPGKEGKITVRLANIAPSVLRDISLKLDLSSSTLPIAPIGSATEKKLPLLERGETALFTYRVIPYPSAGSGVYKIPVNVAFYDEVNNAFSIDDLISVIVGGAPTVSVVLDDVELMQGFRQGTIPIQLVNKDIVDIKFLDVVVGDSDQFILLSPRNNYIGNLDSDDFETLDLKVVNQDPEAKELEVPLHVSYADANNIEYEKNVTVTVSLYPSSILNNGKGPIWPVLLVVAVLVIGGIWFFRRRKKKRSGD